MACGCKNCTYFFLFVYLGVEHGLLNYATPTFSGVPIACHREKIRNGLDLGKMAS